MHPLAARTARRRPRLALEALEGRTAPAVFTVANGDAAGLIAAISASNTNNQSDTINLAAGGTYVFGAAADAADGGSALPSVLTDSALARLEALVATNDGFELAEKDLEIRGEGQLLGTRQAGLSDLRFTRLRSDRKLLEQARECAERLVDYDGPLNDEVERVFAGQDVQA